MPTKVARVHAKGMGPGAATTVLPRHSSGSHGCLCDPATAAVVGDTNDGRRAVGGRILLHSALLPWRVRGSKCSRHHPGMVLISHVGGPPSCSGLGGGSTSKCLGKVLIRVQGAEQAKFIRDCLVEVNHHVAMGSCGCSITLGSSKEAIAT